MLYSNNVFVVSRNKALRTELKVTDENNADIHKGNVSTTGSACPLLSLASPKPKDVIITPVLSYTLCSQNECQKL